MTTKAKLAQDLTSLVRKWHRRERELIEWLSGTAQGGPNGDGCYTITSIDGDVRLVPSPGLLVDRLKGPTTEALDYRDSAQGYAAGASAYAAKAEEAVEEAQAHTKRASKASEKLADALSNARSLVRRHFPSSGSLRVPKKTPKLPKDDDVGTFRWDDQYIYLKTTKGYRRVPLESF